MKLRQKLALVLATAMVVTAVPVVTFAATSNRVTNVVSVAKDTTLSRLEAPELVLKLEDPVTTDSSFYITVENAEFVKLDKAEAGKEYTVDTDLVIDGKTVIVRATSKTELEVTLPKDLQKGHEIRIAMAGKIKEGEAKAIIEQTRAVTGGTFVFANTKTGSVAVKIGEVPSFYTDGGKLAEIELTENVVGAFSGKAKDVTVDGKKLKDVVEVSFELNNSDFEIVKNKLEVKTARGFGSNTITDNVNAVFEKDQVTIYLPKSAVTGSDKGRVVVSGITVDTSKKSPSTGDLNLRISSSVVENKDYKVATIAEYGSKIALKDDKVVGITAGRDEKVTFTLKQVVKDSMVKGRTMDFAIDKGYIFGTEDELKTKINDISGLQFTKVEFKDDDAKTKLITGFTVEVKELKDSYKFEDFKVVGMLGAEGDITLTAEGRALGQELKAVIAKVNPAIKVSTEAVKLEVGIREQKGGKITITETDKEMIKKGNIVITLDKEDGLSFTDKPEVKVTAGDLKLGEVKLDKDKGTVTIPVTRTSRETSTIEVSNFPVKISRSVPDGEYKVELGGTALANEYKTVDKDNKDVTKNYGKQKVADFFIIGEGIASKVKTTITNGATEMIINGEKVALDAPAYIKNDKMMAPLKAIAKAFGIQDKNIVYNAGEIVIFANGRTIQLTIGSKDAFVNGAKMTLANPAEIKAERTNVPVGDIARLLGVAVEWDGATKTATFSN